jgi:PAS domain-containing protein
VLNLHLDLTLIEYSLLAYLVTAAPRIVTPQELISQVDGRSHSLGRLLIFQDITNYNQTNAELEATLEAFPDLIFHLNRQGVFLRYRGGRDAQLFAPPEQFLNRSLRDIFPPDLAEEILAGIMQVCQTGRITTLEYALPMSQGEQFYEARLPPFVADQVIVTVRNLTDRR